ncbi:hypothetical protein COO60DRAFT_1274649 [Scenedesmus sp. NREL 46B-D3]|nr:hypothetical protein COO60DRAFT_1274649 [Scenedesmus sp. NREL 46B-D3]
MSIHNSVSGQQREWQQPPSKRPCAVSAAAAQVEGAKVLNITVEYETGEELRVHIKDSTRMEKLFEACAARMQVDQYAYWFFFHGMHIQVRDTPRQLEMEDGDRIIAIDIWKGTAD